ncbi:MAG TPA: DUF411 domain-containing protein [Candidatus Paceibacterota bacterium]|nr:DUF411 domain-containing protein [Candidatus Paceibacterota bacterium]
MQKTTLITTLGAVLIGSGLLVAAGQLTPEAAVPVAEAGQLDGVDITLYRSPTCGCCAGHAAALEAAGANVDMQNVDGVALQSLKEEQNIPFEKQSCHTSIVEGYVIEGHVPVAAIAQFLEERPETRGITLPGMPIGTPGMPGPQVEPYIVETLEGDVYWRKDPS